jgi:hypothetical protein
MSHATRQDLSVRKAHAIARWQACIKRAAEGDESAMPMLLELMDRPNGTTVFHDLSGRVRSILTKRFACKDLLTKELTIREMKRLRAELIGPQSNVLERMLAERVATGWLDVHIAECRLAEAGAEETDYWQRRVQFAHRRFIAAMRLLASVRRLPRPAMQVNIGEQQVNVSG